VSTALLLLEGRSFGERLRAAGDIAELVVTHVMRCGRCRRYHFTALHVPASEMCNEGRALRLRYRQVRAQALGEDV